LAHKDRPKSRLVAIEGPHGAGKTTLARLVVRSLTRRKMKAVYTKEPFSKELEDSIRKFSTSSEANPTALAFLIAADRSLHIRRIEQWLRDGAIVVSDRYQLSSYVYQRMDGVNPEFIGLLNRQFRQADLTIVLMLPLSLRLMRLKNELRSRPRSRFLSRTALRREQCLYSSLTHPASPLLRVFDSSRPIDNLLHDALDVISSLS